MGSDDFYPEERPVRPVDRRRLLDRPHPVTIADFRRFVKATGYVTVAERPPDPPTIREPTRAAGARLARLPPDRGPVDLRDFHDWWDWVPGATGGTPEGRADTYTRGRHPVMHVAWEDARAYAAWAGSDAAHRGRVGVRRARRARRRHATPGATSSRRAAR